MEHGLQDWPERGSVAKMGTGVTLPENDVVEIEDSDSQLIEPARRPALVHRGMVSAEWAVGIIAAIAIAGVLLSVVTSGEVRDLLLKVILTVIGTFSKFTG